MLSSHYGKIVWRTALFLISLLVIIQIAVVQPHLIENPRAPKQKQIYGIVAVNSVLVLMARCFQQFEGPVAIHDAELYFNDTGHNRTYKLDHNGVISTSRQNTNGVSSLFRLGALGACQ